MPILPRSAVCRFRPGARALLPCAALLFLSTATAAGQQAGLPVTHSPAHLPVHGALVDFGIGSGYAGTGRLLVFGARLQTAFDRIQMVAGAHAVSPDHDDLDTGLGIQASLAYQILAARPRRVLNLQVGVGWTDLDAPDDGGGVTIIDVPLSVSLGAYLPTPAGPAEAWIAPRAHIRYVDVDATGVDSGTRIGPGLSAGLRFTTASPQLGASLAVDGMALRDPAEDGWRFLSAASLTVHLLLLRR